MGANQIEAGCVAEAGAGSKLRFTRRRKKLLEIVPQTVNRAVRFNVRGHYAEGRRVRIKLPNPLDFAGRSYGPFSSCKCMTTQTN